MQNSICSLYPFINLASEHHLLTDPTLSSAHKIANTSYFMYLAVLASMIHALAIPMALEVAQRKNGYTKDSLEWFTRRHGASLVFQP